MRFGKQYMRAFQRRACKTALPEADISVDAMCTASGDDRLNEEVLDVLASIHVEIKTGRKYDGKQKYDNAL